MLVRDIQVFIGFANFYQRFIQDLCKIAILLISLLIISRSSKKLTLKAFKADDNEIVNSDSSKTNETIVNLSKNKKSRNLMYIPSIGVMQKSTFLIFDI